MLFIIVGLTLSIGHNSREYFKDKGFEIIPKINYIDKSEATTSYYDERIIAKKEDVYNCDFVYNVNGFITGFNKSQIIDSVSGRKNCLLTLTPYNIDFIKQIKAAYGNYVTTIFAYIDDTTLNKMTNAIKNPKPNEIETRLYTGRKIKEIYNENIEFFDHTVIYSGEDSLFNSKSVFKQYDYIIKQSLKLEKILNNKMYVELPYSGKKDYIFVSYSHKDRNIVFPILSKLQRDGYRIWYDEGINGGDIWNKLIAEKIKACTDFIVFISDESVKSLEVKNEINAARICKLLPIPARIDDSTFDLEYEMYITQLHNLFLKDESFYNKLTNSINVSTKE